MEEYARQFKDPEPSMTIKEAIYMIEDLMEQMETGEDWDTLEVQLEQLKEKLK
jgi:hypothetical protein